MTDTNSKKLSNIPIINSILLLLDKIKLPNMEGLSLYDLLELYTTGIIKGAFGTRASAVAYSFFMALFPFLLFLIILIPYIPIENFQNDFLAFLETFLPPTTTDFFYENIFENIDGSGILSTVFLLSILLTANGINALFTGFENTYHELDSRNILKQYLAALGVAIILSFVLILTVIGVGLFEIYVIQNLEDFGYINSRDIVFWASLVRNIFTVLMLYFSTAILYYFGTKEGRDFKFFSVGAFFTTILIIATSNLFGLYIENFAQYNKLYGSIGALLILMIFFWLNATIILLGFELNITLKSLRDTNKRKEDAVLY